MSEFSPLRMDSGKLELLDQLALPARETWMRCDSVADVAEAIRAMTVRGAPAIGIAAAYGMAMAASAHQSESAERFAAALASARALLAATRPTAVNLFWALDRMESMASAAIEAGANPEAIAAKLADEAAAIHREDIESCKRIGANGCALLPDSGVVLTHCNAGALATGGYGTALGVLRAGKAAGKRLAVFADETRPYLQGARLTAWELARDGFDVTVIPDSAASFQLARGAIDCALVGADRIAANGDTANKIGTYAVALAAERADVPFYVAAPLSTIDLGTASGADIPIEMREGDEVLVIGTQRIAPLGVSASYPAFDVTPAELVTAIITDRGVARAPYTESLAALFGADR